MLKQGERLMNKNIFSVDGEKFGVINMGDNGACLIAIEPWINSILSGGFNVDALKECLMTRGYVCPGCNNLSQSFWSRFNTIDEYTFGMTRLAVALNVSMARNVVYHTAANDGLPSTVDTTGIIETIFLLTNGRVLFEPSEIESWFVPIYQSFGFRESYLLPLDDSSRVKPMARRILKETCDNFKDFKQRDVEETREEKYCSKTLTQTSRAAESTISSNDDMDNFPTMADLIKALKTLNDLS